MTEIEVIRQKIRQRLNEFADDLASGCATDFSQYKYLTGIIAGLALVERDILDLKEIQEKAG